MATIRGTVRDLVNKKIRVNGVELTQPHIYMLRSMGIIKDTGEVVPNPGKRPSAILEVHPSVEVSFSATED